MSKLLDRLSHFILRLSIRIDHYSDAWMGHPRAWAIRLSMRLERLSDRLFEVAQKKQRGRR